MPSLGISGDAGLADSILSPITLFLHADMVGRLVMLLLLCASIWSWALILGQGFRARSMRHGSRNFERAYTKAESMGELERFYDRYFGSTDPSARIFLSAMQTVKNAGRVIDHEGERERLAVSLESAVGASVEEMASPLTSLATIGSVSPFVGLFGTVWGIMHSFSQIAAGGNTAMAIVGPGIAEALFSTALGLFAAIPASVAYNRMSHSVNNFEAQLNRFSDRIYITLSRAMDARH
ncbi:MAG: MotA/TolQ/ExbB proton channel family protein [Zymomonas mobilis subsp. pomaceae]|uniref:MotA/TolQ/ExbB proton channel n=1 Tax=Zymomonas mobilis subsp. pomaceae (strain ATCC 29192 / DSM 22645 / JCM 10191 / CCUG 17912 / NBRC 13757 / NCIMB 11200 / NRRL B-4491 / Barker I) TaxID=579138 RepID=F8ET34_ZYMMT|nr:MotA/TolQ/ExbB proton channel family protein [Zymomonas mobilis]AEI37938.1 MotA/TolQ/ExbB proton channel [Zymomonas mobilis subsp. pomaceae ATCC 29192]MDX5949307.1 MotA/TolQ/ExbB proton channel family protein [Zymomonas mobilis subsp. pomaceae]GEB89686.1 Tol-Pal system subunit TolQ [Zymomonas mobilis subsp. pomaceae]